MLIGLINFPEIEDNDKVEREIAYLGKRYQNVIVKRFFVFNYSFDPSTSVKKQATPSYLSHPHSDPDAIQVLPPSDGICEGGNMIDVHIKEVMSVACVKLIMFFDEQLEAMENARVKGSIPTTLTNLTTPMDSIEDSVEGGASKLLNSVKKRPYGRIRKWMGDLCLQVQLLVHRQINTNSNIR